MIGVLCVRSCVFACDFICLVLARPSGRRFAAAYICISRANRFVTHLTEYLGYFRARGTTRLNLEQRTCTPPLLQSHLSVTLFAQTAPVARDSQASTCSNAHEITSPFFLRSSRRSVMATLDLRKLFRERC